MQSAGTPHVITLVDGKAELLVGGWIQLGQKGAKSGRGTTGRRVFGYAAERGKHPGMQDAVIGLKEDEQ
jgi:hypothetical protein